jgi:Raf kinase inhibitor-like YbhB/YbcL family protein
MRKVLRFTVIFFAAILTLMLYQLMTNTSKQKDEVVYHAKLNKSITLKSTDFENGGIMPEDVSDNGINHSPQLNWDTLPAETKSLALMVTDYDAPSPAFHLFTASHWVIYNIPIDVHSLAKGIPVDELKKAGMDIGKNYAGNHIYTGPKPPFGVHQYYFRIYALDFDHLFLKNDNRDELYKAMQGHIVGYGELIGNFRQ